MKKPLNLGHHELHAQIVKIDENEVVRLILQFLQTKRYFKTFITLEQESQITLESYSKEIKFFRSLIMDGCFEEAETFLYPLEPKLNDNYLKSLFEIKKQQYFELIDAKPDVQVLVQLLKEIEGLVSQDVYKNLCFFLTLKSINDHPEYIDWSIQKGRLDCFEKIHIYLQRIFKEKENIQQLSSSLKDLIERLSLYELSFMNEVPDFLEPSQMHLINNNIIFDAKKKFAVTFVNDGMLTARYDTRPAVSQLYQKPVNDYMGQSLNFLPETEQKNNQLSDLDKSNELEYTNKPSKSKLAFHNRIRSNEMNDSQQSAAQAYQLGSQFYQESKKTNVYSFRNDSQQIKNLANRKKSKNSSGEQDKNIIIEKLYISDCTNDGSENESQQQQEKATEKSQLFNYNFEEVFEVGHLTDTHPIRAATFSADGEYFAIGTNSKSLRIYSMKSLLSPEALNTSNDIPILQEKKNHHLGSIYCIDWSKSGNLIATGSNDKIIKIINYHTFEEVSKLQGHRGIIRSICFTHDETRLLSAGQVDTQIKVWDVEKGKNIANLEGHTQAVYCVQLGGDGSYQVSVGMDRTLRMWDQRVNKCVATIMMTNYGDINYVSLSESTSNYNLQNLIKGTKRAQQIKSQSLAALAHSDGKITVWNLAAQKQMQVLSYHDLDCRCVEFDPTAKYLASASFDGSIGVYDWEQQQLVTSIRSHEDRVVLCKWHPFYPFILSTSADQSGRVFAPKGFLVQLIKSFNQSQQ